MSLVGFQARNHPQQAAKSFFAELHARFGFTLDVAASLHNAKLPRFFTAEDDGLAQSWAGERVWCIPPYSDISPWVDKAWASRADLVVMLLPGNRTEQTWWQDLVEPYRDRGGVLRTEFIRGRTRFIAAGDTGIKPNARPPFGCVLLVWGESARR